MNIIATNAVATLTRRSMRVESMFIGRADSSIPPTGLPPSIGQDLGLGFLANIDCTPKKSVLGPYFIVYCRARLRGPKNGAIPASSGHAKTGNWFLFKRLLGHPHLFPSPGSRQPVVEPHNCTTLRPQVGHDELHAREHLAKVELDLRHHALLVAGIVSSTSVRPELSWHPANPG